MAISDWQYLRCDCGGDLFMPLVKMKYKADGGTVSEPAGHKCSACGAVVDSGYLARLIEIDRKRRTIRELQSEVDASEVTRISKTVTLKA